MILHLRKKIVNCFNSSLLDYADYDCMELYRIGREAYLANDFELARRCERLNKILNNCYVSSKCDIGELTKIAYGGIGVLIHPSTRIGTGCMIGTNVTLGAAPYIGDYVYIATGAKLIGTRITIGDFSIIGANTVVSKNVPPFSIIYGNSFKKLTPDNLDKYLMHYLASVNKRNNVYVDGIKDKFLKSYEEFHKDNIFNITSKCSDISKNKNHCEIDNYEALKDKITILQQDFGKLREKLSIQNKSLIRATKNIVFQSLYKKSAFALVNTNQLDRAEAIAQNIIANNPYMAWAYYILGKVQWQRGEQNLALENLDRAIALEPKIEYFTTFKNSCLRKFDK